MAFLSTRAVGAYLLLYTSVAFAADTDPLPLTLPAAIAQSLARNPELQSFAFRLRAQQGRAATADLRPAPELKLELEDVLGTGVARGTGAAQLTFALSQVIELGGKRDQRNSVASAGISLLDVEHQAAQLDVLAEVARRFIHVAADQEQQRLTQRATALAQTTVEAAQQRLNAAKAPEVELRRARIQLARAQVDEEHAEHELLSSRRKLAAMWGDTTPAFGVVTTDLYRLPAAGTFETLLAGAQNNPDTLRFASETRLRDAEIRLAETRARADVGLSAGVRRLQETRDQALVFGFSMPLFGGSRADGAVAEARAVREETANRQDAHRVRVQAQLFELHQELRHSITEASVLRETVMPEMEAALSATRYAFERGRYSYLEWVDAQRELIGAQRALIEAAKNAHLYQAEIERLTGQPLSPVQP